MVTNFDECSKAEPVVTMMQVTGDKAGADSGSGESSEEIIFEVNNLISVGIN